MEKNISILNNEREEILRELELQRAYDSAPSY